ncbi:ferredoxin [Candidatus Pacearchaeota archaeon]|nr:MAG: ferredoxin [Candidatus Pacearchaeota archaeon]
MTHKISVDKKTCIGCGTCAALCPESFKMEGDKAVPIKEEVDKISCEKEAEEACPVDAIKVE